MCKSFAPHSRQTTTPVPHHSVFAGQMPFWYPTDRVKALKAKQWRQKNLSRYTKVYNILDWWNEYFPNMPAMTHRSDSIVRAMFVDWTLKRGANTAKITYTCNMQIDHCINQPLHFKNGLNTAAKDFCVINVLITLSNTSIFNVSR